VAQLVTVFKKPICTTSAAGYFVANAEAEKRGAQQSGLDAHGERRAALTNAER
jgi:hypothetical protein